MGWGEGSGEKACERGETGSRGCKSRVPGPESSLLFCPLKL